MRTRLLVLAALVSVPVVVTAQVGVGRRGAGVGTTLGQPPLAGAPLPPQAPIVNQALSYHRSRWSAEGYTLISSITTVDPNGGNTQTNAFGTGTRADYRLTDYWSATADFTAAFLGGSTTAETAEIGTRFRPLPYSANVRPYLDIRGGYTHVHDSFYLPTSGTGPLGGPGLENSEIGRYARGVGAIVGTGFDYTLTSSLALSTEFTAGRHRMDAYHITGLMPLPNRNAYWMNVYRFTVGLRYNAVSALHLAEK
jgi:hypothetical protein